MTDPITQSMMQAAAGAAGDGLPMLENMFRINSYMGDSNAATSLSLIHI